MSNGLSQVSPATILSIHSLWTIITSGRIQPHLLTTPQVEPRNIPQFLYSNSKEQTCRIHSTSATLLVKAPLFMAFFCRDLLSCRFIAICQRSHSVASPRKATQHHRSLSGRNPLIQSSEKQDLLQVRYTPSTSSFPSWTLLMKQLLSWASTEEFFF